MRAKYFFFMNMNALIPLFGAYFKPEQIGRQDE
jgi:hypothetical protein